MLHYDIKINSLSLFTVCIIRKEPLSTLYKYNKYYYSATNSIGIKYEGIVKHKYVDGLFILINKVNKEIHNWMKNKPEIKLKIKRTFDNIKLSQELIGKIEIYNNVKRKRDIEAEKIAVKYKKDHIK